MTRLVELKTPGRLHFGLTRFRGTGRQYGGLGLMVDGSGVSLAITPAPTFQTVGPLQQRVQDFADGFATYLKLPGPPACKLEVTSASPEHVGLGVGTQLGLAVAAGLAQWLNLPWRDAKLLGAMSGRGHRSAIGTHGFLQGGLLVDAGKLPNETLGQLADRIEVPTQWRFILIRQPSARGLAGNLETQTMHRLPPVPERVTAELERLIHEEILPAAKTANCQEFSEAIYRYGHLAGECFALAQGGPFATPDIAELIGDLQQLGVAGVGQSSWGPTVFAITADAAAAQQLVSHLQADRRHQHRHFTIVSPNNSGVCAQVTAE